MHDTCLVAECSVLQLALLCWQPSAAAVLLSAQHPVAEALALNTHTHYCTLHKHLFCAQQGSQYASCTLQFARSTLPVRSEYARGHYSDGQLRSTYASKSSFPEHNALNLLSIAPNVVKIRPTYVPHTLYIRSIYAPPTPHKRPNTPPLRLFTLFALTNTQVTLQQRPNTLHLRQLTLDLRPIYANLRPIYTLFTPTYGLISPTYDASSPIFALSLPTYGPLRSFPEATYALFTPFPPALTPLTLMKFRQGAKSAKES
jgi:hypothetical protein